LGHYLDDFLGTAAASPADDREDAKAIRHDHFADLNVGDVDAWMDHHLVGHSEFRAGGGFLIEPASPEAEKASLGGRVHQVHDRLSTVLVKEGGEWKEAHIHRSPLIIETPEGPESRFVGTWSLVSLESRSTSGEVTRPFGDSPLGRLTYHSNGKMSVFAIRPDRPHFASGGLQGGTPGETQAAFDGLVS
jgi:hypothetical protein